MIKRLAWIVAFLMCATTAHATTWYVATNGDNSRSCMTAQNPATPKLTLKGGTGVLQCVGAAGSSAGADDTVSAGDGIYTESLIDVIPSGSGVGHEFTLKCGTYRGCTLNENLPNYNIGFNTASAYIILKDFIITGGGGLYTSSGSVTFNFQYLTFTGNEFVALPTFANSFTGADYVTFTGNSFHDIGHGCSAPGLCHGIYQGIYSDYFTIENNQFFDIDGYGIHVYPDVNVPLSTGDIINGNLVHDNGCGNACGGGMAIYGYDHVIMNNLVYANDNAGILLRVAGNNQVFNNTVISNVAQGIYVESGVSNQCKNNIVLSNGATAIQGCQLEANNQITGLLADNFNSPATADYTLLMSSPAVGTGATLSVVMVDYAGTPRTVPYDKGAYKCCGADIVGPTVTALVPADDSTNVPVNTPISVQFSEPIFRQAACGVGCGMTLYKCVGDVFVETFEIMSDVTIVGDTATMQPSSPLVASTTCYYMQVDDNNFEDADGNPFPGIKTVAEWNWETEATADVVPPTVTLLSPLDGATGVSVAVNPTMTFNKTVFVGTGNWLIKKCSDNSTLQTIAITSGAFTGWSTTTLTLVPTVLLPYNTCTYNIIPNTAILSASGVAFAGYSGTGDWNYTTDTDTTAPMVSYLTPVNNAARVSPTVSFVMGFTEPVLVNTGNIVIKKCSDNTTFETIAVGSMKVTGSTTATITINPSGTMAFGTCYYVQVARGGFVDSAGNAFAGFLDTRSWRVNITP